MKMEHDREGRAVSPGPRIDRIGGTKPAGHRSSIRESEETNPILDIPETELTPKARQAITTLLDEVGKLRSELEQHKARLSQLERLADEDTLIRVPNRRAFVRELSRMISYAQRYGTPSSLLYFDLNALKAINDTHGHATGDAALKHVAGLLRENVRDSDTVGRLGGDEFGVILVHSDMVAASQKAAELARIVAQTPLLCGGARVELSVAYGIHSFFGDESALDALAAADKAMYARKQTLLAAAETDDS